MIASNPRWRKIRRAGLPHGTVLVGVDVHDKRNDPTMYRPGSITQLVDSREHRRSARMKTGDHEKNWSVP